MPALFMAVLALMLFSSCSKGGKDTRLVVITYDGLRWQEVFNGADEQLLNNPDHVSDPEAAKAAYWRDDLQERREALLPFLWSYVPQHGYIIGNRDKNSLMQVANSKSFSYPGYSEMFCGYPDDERIDSNDPNPNPNRSVLEAVNADPRYKDQVMMISSWESIRYAVNNDRGGFLGSSGHEPAYVTTEVTELLQQMDRSCMSRYNGSERDDAITYGLALEILKNKHPKVFYIGFGDTDEYGHSGNYVRYLDSANWTDDMIRGIVETCEADPFYKGKTTYLLLTDHGRGRGTKFTSHSADVRGSNQTWFMAFGKDVPVLGETSNNGVFYNKQLAATIADILGVDFTPDNGEKCDPIDPEYFKEPEAPVAQGSFEAVKASPKGQGLRYTYAEGDFMSVVPMLSTPVKARGITPVLTTDMKLREDHFGLVFKGLVKIPQDGVYILSLASDDGSKLILDGELLWDIDRDGGGYQEKCLQLGAGYHRIELQYFENHGGETVEIGIVGNGLDADNLPADMLYYE